MRSLTPILVYSILASFCVIRIYCSSSCHPSRDARARSTRRQSKKVEYSNLSVCRRLGWTSRAAFTSPMLRTLGHHAGVPWQPGATVVRRFSPLATRDFRWHQSLRSSVSVVLPPRSSDCGSNSSSRSLGSHSSNGNSGVAGRLYPNLGAGKDLHDTEKERNDLSENKLAAWPAILSHNNGVGLAETVKQAAQWLEMHDVVDPEPSAAELLAKAAGFRSPQEMSAKFSTSAADLSLEMSAAEWDEMRRLCSLRAARHVPVQYLVGEWEFHRLSLEMQPPTLIPRPETEELVEIMLNWLRQGEVYVADDRVASGIGGTIGGGCAGLRFLDVGSGTGAIGLALLNELPGAYCVAIDAQRAAVLLSRRNAERTGLQARYCCSHVEIANFDLVAATKSGVHTTPEENGVEEVGRREDRSAVQELAAAAARGGVDGTFDFIVSNPPYIPRRDMEALPSDVADHEDAVALDGGEDGLDVVREIVRRCPRLLRKGGPRQLWMEVDTSHPEAMQRWLGLEVGGAAVQECKVHGVTRFEWMRDMSQRPRFVRLTFAEETGS